MPLQNYTGFLLINPIHSLFVIEILSYIDAEYILSRKILSIYNPDGFSNNLCYLLYNQEYDFVVYIVILIFLYRVILRYRSKEHTPKDLDVLGYVLFLFCL
jgi:predicted Zn-dependent protease